MSFKLVCIECGNTHDNSQYRILCDKCRGLLDARYDIAPTLEARVVSRATGTARYLPLLPIRNSENLVTMNEGNTPLVRLSKISDELGLASVWGKMEFFNPTGTFKDRGNCVQVSVLKDTGVVEVAESTGGNGGNSTAAYCARAGIVYHAFMSTSIKSSQKANAIVYHGAKVHWIDGDKLDVEEATRNFSKETGILHLRYGENTYFIEGKKLIAYELPDQMDSMPDHVVVPVGNGSILMGIYKGFRDMLEDGRINKIPALHAVQVEEVQPLVAAFEGREWTATRDEPKSRATGITVKVPPRPQVVAQNCRDTGGQVIALAENRILWWHKRLASLEGLLVEPASAATLAGSELLRQRGVIKQGETVLVPLTSLGIREPLI